MSDTFETHIERMDVLQFESAQKEKLARIESDRAKYVAKQNKKKEQVEGWIIAAISFSVATVLSFGVYAIWIDDNPKSPYDYKNSETYREAQCYDNGGGWVPKDLLIGDSGVCVFPGKQVEAPAS